MQKELKIATDILNDGGSLLYPTDTIWGIGCDATNPEAVKKVYAIKRRSASKALVCLVADFSMLQKYITKIPDDLQSILEAQTKPTTVIFSHPTGLAKNLLAEDHSVAIRICKNHFCQQLIKKFGRPIVSTSANISGSPAPASFDQIDPKIIKSVDYVVNLPLEKKGATPSQIIKIGADQKITIIRE